MAKTDYFEEHVKKNKIIFPNDTIREADKAAWHPSTYKLNSCQGCGCVMTVWIEIEMGDGPEIYCSPCAKFKIDSIAGVI